LSDGRAEAELIRGRGQALAVRNPAYRELCELVVGLLLQTLDHQPPPPPLGEGAAAGLARGRPLWPGREVPVDWPAAWELAERLAAWLRPRPGSGEAVRALARLRRRAGPGPGLLGACLRGENAALETAASRAGAEPPVVELLLRTALRPWLRAAARTAPQARLAVWRRGECPVCGSEPGMAELDSRQGSRRLHCLWCETRWDHSRLACPFCRGQAPGSLTYLEAVGEEGLRLEVCDLCGRHLKTLDMRRLEGPVVAPLDDAATWHLDLLARRRWAP
jgi:transcription elongation factor Elf1